jgi:SnoaL-like domain
VVVAEADMDPTITGPDDSQADEFCDLAGSYRVWHAMPRQRRPEEGLMDPTAIANLYYDAWINRRGDMSQVPLADDLVFHGPVASFDSADGYRAMARQAGAAVTSFRVRHQFTDANLVCTVVDWTMAPVRGTLRGHSGTWLAVALGGIPKAGGSRSGKGLRR